jgi:hypothetical protein
MWAGFKNSLAKTWKIRNKYVVTVFRFTPPPFPETKRWLLRSPLFLCPSLKFFKQRTRVHKSSGAEIFCGNIPWKHERKINVVTVRKYCYLGFRLSIISEPLQVNTGNFVWAYGSPNLEYIRITCEIFWVNSYKRDTDFKLRYIRQTSRIKNVLLVNMLFTTINLLIMDNTKGFAGLETWRK